ncbi:hypothetical protein [Dokdonella koreensis]|nr:hypothetical protein [Dokdonella koreensis]
MLTRTSPTTFAIAAALSAAFAPPAGAVPPPATSSPAAPREAASGMVLYRQQADFYSGGLTAQTATDGNPTKAADDFTVTDADGWTVSAFNFAIAIANPPPVTAGITYNLTVHADAAGLPNAAAPALCAATAVAGILDNDDTMLSVPLPQACLLPKGTYWVALQANIDGDGSQPLATALYWNGYLPSPTPGATAAWQSPAAGCATWQPATSCNTATSALGFDVVGYPGGGDGTALTLTLTMALDNGDPTQCGTATRLTVSAGDKVNFCYTMTNRTGIALDYQTLGDTQGGLLFSLRQQALGDGQSLRYNRLVTTEIADSGVIQATLTGQDRLPGYDYTSSGSSRFVDITGVGTRMELGNDNTLGVDMPFSFNFYGTTTNQLGIATNGGLYVGMVRPLWGDNGPLPNGGLGGPAMLPLWDDFDSAPGGIYYATLGTAPNRRFVVQWDDLVHYDGASNTDGATFQVIIDEATGTFSYEYADVQYSAIGASPDPASCNGGACATIGVQRDAAFSTQVGSGNVVVGDGTSIAWFPGVIDNAFTTSAAVTLDVGAPVVSVAPGALIGSAQAGATTQVPLTLGNTGSRALTWSIDTAAADRDDPRAHFPAMPYHATPASVATLRELADAQVATDGTPVSAPFLPRDTGPLTDANVPAYAIGGVGPGGGAHPDHLEYFPLDAAYPSVLGSIAAYPIDTYTGGAFAHNDFSKQYVIGRGGGFFTVDTANGQMTYVGFAPTAPNVWLTDLAWDPATQTMYVTGWDVASTSVSYLYTIDLASAALTQVARIDGTFVTSATFDATGHLYGLDARGAQLIAIDKRNGQWQGIGAIGFTLSNIGSIDFDPRTGVLWYAGHPYVAPGFPARPAIYTIDPANGRASEVGPTRLAVDLVAFSLAIPYAGCTAPDEVPWLRVTPASGVIDAGRYAGLTATLDATHLAAGRYEATVCVRSNDLTRRIVAVPVRFTVGGGQGDGLFDDGFETP